MPTDNAGFIAIGAPILFPNDGFSQGSITRDPASLGSFVLNNVGTYRIDFYATVTESAQLILALDTGSGVVEIPNSVVGRATGTSIISGFIFLQVVVPGSKISLRNPVGNNIPITITPSSGGTRAISSRIIINRITL
jgi:hypothetical protein